MAPDLPLFRVCFCGVRSRFLLSSSSCPNPLPPTSSKSPVPRPGRGRAGRPCPPCVPAPGGEGPRRPTKGRAWARMPYPRQAGKPESRNPGEKLPIKCCDFTVFHWLFSIRVWLHPPRPLAIGGHPSKKTTCCPLAHQQTPLLARCMESALSETFPPCRGRAGVFSSPRSAATGSSLRPALPLSYRVENPESSPCTPTPSSSTASANATA